MTTVTEALNGLTGMDEIAISKHFGSDWTQLSSEHPTMFTRALVMIDKVHQGVAAPQAKADAMNLTVKDLSSYFEAEAPEIDPDDPPTESGKDS